MKKSQMNKLPAFRLTSNQSDKNTECQPAEILLSPQSALVRIDLEIETGFYPLFHKYLLVPTIGILFTSLLMKIITLQSISQILIQGIVYPALMLGIFFSLLFTIGIILEETAEQGGGRFSPGAGNKLALIPAVPFIMTVPVMIITMPGLILCCAMLAYQIYIMRMGGEQVLNIPKANSRKWFLTMIMVFAGLIGIFLLFMSGVFFVGKLF